jgi:hypothetical protein
MPVTGVVPIGEVKAKTTFSMVCATRLAGRGPPVTAKDPTAARRRREVLGVPTTSTVMMAGPLGVETMSEPLAEPLGVDGSGGEGGAGLEKGLGDVPVGGDGAGGASAGDRTPEGEDGEGDAAEGVGVCEGGDVKDEGPEGAWASNGGAGARMGEGDGEEVAIGEGEGRMGLDVGTLGPGEALMAGSGAVASPRGNGERGLSSGAGVSAAGWAMGARWAVAVGATGDREGRFGDVPAGSARGAAPAGPAVGSGTTRSGSGDGEVIRVMVAPSIVTVTGAEGLADGANVGKGVSTADTVGCGCGARLTVGGRGDDGPSVDGSGEAEPKPGLTNMLAGSPAVAVGALAGLVPRTGDGTVGFTTDAGDCGTGDGTFGCIAAAGDCGTTGPGVIIPGRMADASAGDRE